MLNRGGKKPRVAVYPRVSSRNQKEAGSIKAQLHLAPEYIARSLGGTLVRSVDHYSDDGKSATAGKLDKRTGLLALFADAMAGEFDIVLVYDVDRLTRSEDWGERGMIIGTLQKAGVVIADMMGGYYDPNTAEGDLMLSMKTSMSADYSRKLSDRVKDGFARALREGRKPSGQTPYGLIWNKETRTFSLHEEASKIVVEVFERIRARWTYSEIAADMNARGVPTSHSKRKGATGRWCREWIYKMVHKTVYRGEWRRKSSEVVLKVPAIISDELWYAAHDTLNSYGNRGLVKTRHDYLLHGLMRCGICGSSIGVTNAVKWKRGVTPKKGSRAYVCSRRRRPTDRINPGPRCTLPRYQTEALDSAVWEELRERLRRPGEIEAELIRRQDQSEQRDWATEIAKEERKLSRLEENELMYMNRHERGLISAGALDKMLTSMAKEREAIGRRMKHAQEAAAKERPRVDVHAALARLRPLLDDASPETQKQVVREAVWLVELRPDYQIRLELNPSLDGSARPPTMPTDEKPTKTPRGKRVVRAETASGLKFRSDYLELCLSLAT